MNRDDAEEYTGALGQIVAGGWRQVALGERLGVPDALGLTTRQWVKDRLGGYVRLSISERREAIAELVADGMTQREVADVLGIGQATVHRDSSESKDDRDQHEPAPGDSSESRMNGRRLEAVYSSGSDDWSTPDDLFAALDDEFGFELDVCASAANTKCPLFFTRDVDGLAQDWGHVTCWMNPPYGDAIAAWMGKAHQAADDGATVVCLVPARTDTGWWWDHARYGEVRFMRGRLRFGDTGTAPFPSAVVVFGYPPGVVWWEP